MVERARWGTYQDIAEELRTRITSGHLTPEDTFPTEAAIGREFAVSRTTVRRALAVLEDEGRVRAVPGIGRRVCTAQEREAGGGKVEPRYKAIAEELRGRIARGEFAPGGALPSEVALGREFGVSRMTARTALTVLEDAGLVEAVQGRGRFVSAPRNG